MHEDLKLPNSATTNEESTPFNLSLLKDFNILMKS